MRVNVFMKYYMSHELTFKKYIDAKTLACTLQLVEFVPVVQKCTETSFIE